MNRYVRTCLLLVLLLFSWVTASAGNGADGIRVVRVNGAITPPVADFIATELSDANKSAEKAFLLELDTPGGLDTAMRDIIKAMLASRIPVIAYVYPAGARAASAGALITLAADFAVMAPGTNIGAAHPVAVGAGGQQDTTMMDKVLADAVAYARSLAEQRGRNVDWAERIVRESISTSASEALQLKVIDMIAADEQELIEGLHGRRYLRQGQALVLDIAGAELNLAEMSWRQKILATISNPNVAYMLLMLGIMGIFFEISQPGGILPGALGAIALLLALFAFQTLPINYAGVLLILLAIILFILEVKIVSYGMLSIGGLVAMTLGSLMLIESSEPYLQISRAIIAATVAVFGGFFLLVLFFVVRTQKSRFVSGAEGMVGERGRAVTPIHGDGKVFVHGEYWNAFSKQPIGENQDVVVVRLEGNLRMEVAPWPASEPVFHPVDSSIDPGQDVTMNKEDL
ncbi:MAG: nodulation protein NfeD [Desulfuromonadales bacterium]|nr:nodulation protein NfeD [Desulfuromonadales bacterium]MDW7756327.1 nodulation protein NfeD [Desulfuromonadales bacterium]